MPDSGNENDVRELLRAQIENEAEVLDIFKTASEVRNRWVDPLSGGDESTNGLIYGLVQSGKTGVLTAAAAMGADEGYKTLLVLTTDIDPLYEQTLSRVRQALPQVDIIAKQDFKDVDGFVKRVRQGNCAIVTSKNGSLLANLVENFKKGRLKGLPTLIIDDEADQASLNTRIRKLDKELSRINGLISELRDFFGKNTYLQVTATPQALFLQGRDHGFRPKFTVLSKPGADYVGGDDFFSDNSSLIQEFDIADIAHMSGGGQPAPNNGAPSSLIEALDHFMVAATFKRLNDPTQNCAFLCHVSMRKDDHDLIVAMLRRYKDELRTKLGAGHEPTALRIKAAFEKLSKTHPPLAVVDFRQILERIGRYAPGVNIKKVNGETDEDVALQSPYNLFVGGNKLGRGVTIKNLLVSYYGRHPKRPQADTVLQHARMYGYRRKDLGLLRLFLPKELHKIFQSIYAMETTLRKLIEQQPGEKFRALYLEDGLTPTRKNVLAPGSLGIYSAGSSYNPAQILRTDDVTKVTRGIDKLVEDIGDKKYKNVAIGSLLKLIDSCVPDPEEAEGVWDKEAITAALKELAKARESDNAYLYVDRNRDLRESRRESQGILTSGEAETVPTDLPTLFLLRTTDHGKSNAAWWPQVRFPAGPYAFAFAI
jgi:hypothetical protein